MKQLIISVIMLSATSCAFAQGWQMPMMPPYLRTVDERALYLAGHYWDSLDWSNPEVAADTAAIESVYADFCQLLPVLSPDKRKEAVAQVLSSVSSGNAGGYGVIMDLAGKYLWQTDSPVYSEESYRPFVEYGLMVSPDDPILKSRQEELSKNPVGSKASDIDIIEIKIPDPAQQPATTTNSKGGTKKQPATASDSKGEAKKQPATASNSKGEAKKQPATASNSKGGMQTGSAAPGEIPAERTTLYQTLNPAGETVIVFYSPGCSDCRDFMAALASDPGMGLKISRGELGVTAIYVGDDEAAWRKDALQWPSEWRIAMSADPDEDAYSVRRTPTLCLLGSDGTVLMRNATPVELLERLR